MQEFLDLIKIYTHVKNCHLEETETTTTTTGRFESQNAEESHASQSCTISELLAMAHGMHNNLLHNRL